MEIITLQYIYTYFLFACIKCWLVKFAGYSEKHEHTSSFPSCLIKMCTNSRFFVFFLNNLSPESKGGLNYFYLFSLYRERVGFITLIYFTFLLSPRQQTVSSASSRGCMFNAIVISDLRSPPSKVSYDIDWEEDIYPW